MANNRVVVGALNKKGKVKNPSLGEVCSFFNIPFSEEFHHGAMYDISRTFDILCEMDKACLPIQG
jgi:DNA polymerase-3 subunit epsilon